MKEVATSLSLNPSDSISNLWSAKSKPNEKLEAFLERSLLPSLKRGGKVWMRNLQEILGQDCDKTVAKAIIVLIDWRNKFVHSTHDLDHYIMNVDGSTLKSWKLAVYIFAVWVTQAATIQQQYQPDRR